MFSKKIKAAVAGAIILAGWGVCQTSSQAQSMQSTFISVGERTLVPYGWLDFCNRYAGECAPDVDGPTEIKLTAAAFRRIAHVNKLVNKEIEAVSDADQWGVVDRWDYPTSRKGDCEDYVLLKRRLLIEEGFSARALLVTVVRDERNEGHAVLTVRTTQGDFVLDNLREGVRPWTDTPYRFVKRQSQTDPNIWVDLHAPQPARVAAR
ncbi:MAG TPA: transglutaminase-like cysteine peptidase [Beijerinckiaceae bacterium]|jgi:predicted transglutaminase-like cysteine proteinase